MMLPVWVEEWRAGRAWMTNAVLALLGCALVLLAHQFTREQTVFWLGFNGTSELSAVVYLAAVLIVMWQPVDRWTFWIVLGFALAMRAMTLFDEPFLSSDIYRYVWDGIVQHAGVNPYRYVPGDVALTALRAPHQEIFDNINRRDYAHTIYPPVAQMLYWVATLFSPTVQAMKVMMLGFEAVTVGALVSLLRLMGRRKEEVLLYAWCPLLVWEIGDAGHVDAAIMAFVVMAILFRYKNSPVWTGVFLGCAVLTKFYPLVLFPALWQRKDWKMPAVMVAMAAVGYGIYSSVGMGVFGFFGGYTKEEGMDTGARYFLLQLVQHVPGLSGVKTGAYFVFCAVVLGGITWWAWRRATVEVCAAVPGDFRQPTHDQVHVMNGAPRFRSPVFMRVAMVFAFAMMLLFSPHYPWYVAWLIPFFVLVPNVPLVVYLMMFFYMFTTPLADGKVETMYLLNKILYGVTALGVVVQMLWRGWSRTPVRTLAGAAEETF